MSTALSPSSTSSAGPFSAAGGAGSAPELEAVERAIELALVSDWARLGVLGLNEVLVSELQRLGFSRGPNPPRAYPLKDDRAVEAFVLDTLIDSNSGQLLTVRTSIRASFEPGRVAETSVSCTVFRPGPRDTVRAWMAAMLVGQTFGQTAAMLSTKAPDWYLPPEERDPNTGLDQAMLSHMQALSMVRDPELARPKAVELALELLAALSP